MKSSKVIYLLVAALFLLSSAYAVKFSLAEVGDSPGETVGDGTGGLFIKAYEGMPGEAMFGELTSDPDGGYIMAGNYFGNPKINAWVIKLDDNGSIEWQKAFGYDQHDMKEVKCVRQSKTGHYFVVGTFDPQHTHPTTWGNEWFVFKLDSKGSPVWAKVWGRSDSTNQPYFVEPTNDGGCIVAGEAPPAPGERNTLTVLKLDADGNPEFKKSYGEYAKGYSIQQTEDSGYIVAGEIPVPGYDQEVWILKLDDNGTVVWQKRYGGPKWDSPRSIRQTSEGGYIVAGGTENWGAGYYDVWVMKLDDNGTVVWQNAYGGDRKDKANSVWQTSDGGYIVAGERGYVDHEATGDIWVLKLDINGSVVWQRAAGSASNDAMYSAQEKDGAYFLTGTMSLGTGGPAPYLYKIDDNGTIPDCTAFSTPPFSLTQTDAIPVTTTVVAKPLSIEPVDIVLTETDTSSVSRSVCSGTMTQRPNLTPYKPQGWSDKIVVSNKTGTLTDDSPLYTTDSLYVDWAVTNDGQAATAKRFDYSLARDGAIIAEWYSDPPINPNKSAAVKDYAIGSLKAGTHTLKIVADSSNDITESDESDNEYTKTFTVIEPTGAIKIDIMPVGLTGAQWRVDGGSWHNSGETVSGLTVGNHEVTFKDVAGWTTPAPQSVAITSGETTSATGTYVQQTGSLQVTIVPGAAITAGAKWSVDDGPWRDSGAMVSGLTAGIHTVKFKGINGWTKPDAQSVTVNSGQTTSATGTYVQQTGSLKVTILPDAALAAGAKWSADGGLTWKNSGETISLPVGPYTVTFSEVTGWTKPAAQAVTVTNGQTTSATGTYIQQTGFLKVVITPIDAVTAGAKWSADGGLTWKNSGEAISLPVGPYTVTFSEVTGWTKPGSQSLTVNNGKTTSATATYIRQTGSLQVTLVPDGAMTAGAKWSVDGGPWYAGGYIASGLAVGSHTVAFKGINGWTKPAAQAVTIIDGQTTSATGTYIQQTGSLKVTITPDGALTAGAKWSADGGITWRNSGETISLPVGSHTVTFKDVSGWNKPSAQAVTIKSGRTTSAGGAYIRQTGSLQITIAPDGAVSAGAKWSVDGGPWYAGGYVATGLTVGPHTVTFKGIGGWNKPAALSVIVTNGETTSATGTYIQHTGFLKVAITPAGAVTAGARWSVDGGLTWKNSDETISLPPGSYTITFKDATGWAKPASQSVTVTNGQTTSATGYYTKADLPNLYLSKRSDWSDFIVVSNKTGSYSDDTPLYSNDPLYIDWMVANNGALATSGVFSSKLFVDGVEKSSWDITEPLWIYGSKEYPDCPLAPLSVGTHTIKVVIDTAGSIPESNEADNEYTRTITIEAQKAPNLVPYQPGTWPDAIVVYPKEGAANNDDSLYTADDLYVDCAIANIGTAAAQNFHITLYIDDVLEVSWLKRNTARPDWHYWWKRINIGQLSAGTHEMKLVVDSSNEVEEINEADNTYTRTILVEESAAGQLRARSPRSHGSMDGVQEGSAPLD